MLPYGLRRCLIVIPTLVGITILAFALSRLNGDPAGTLLRQSLGRDPSAEELAAERKALRLDRPVVLQYLDWAGRAARGDLGRSYVRGTPVAGELRSRARNTLRLAVPAALLAAVLGLSLGMVAAVHQNRPIDQALRVGALVAASVPSYWAAFLLIELLAVRMGVLPAGGMAGPRSMVLPVVTLAIGPAAVLARFTRSSMIGTLGDEYVRTAMAKGMAWRRVVSRHSLRNSLVPVLTAFGHTLGRLLAGAVIVETIYAWPGVGSFAVTAIRQQDFPVIQGFVLYSGLVFLAVNLVVDLSYGVIDARVRVGARGGAR